MRRGWVYDETAIGKHFATQRKTTKLKFYPDQFENLSSQSTKFRVQTAGNYPFVSGSPDIDYTLCVVFTDSTN